jgi:hypothetical protein
MDFYVSQSVKITSSTIQSLQLNLSWKIAVVFLLASSGLYSQELKTKNIIIVTLDGYRWQEIFEGPDQSIILNPRYVKDTTVARAFDGTDAQVKRQKLMPFLWTVIAGQGQLYGNRNYKNKVNCVNNHLLSYPGYSEMLVGYHERSVSSNDKRVNPNPTVLEFINKHQGFHKKVAAFATWDVFPYIFREKEAKIYVNAGNEIAEGKITANEERVNQQLTADVRRSDEHTFSYAFEYLKREHPRVMFIGFDATDTNAHGGHYDKYLQSAHTIDGMLEELWNWVQSHPEYKDQTTLLITTDHGRGKGKNSWKNHRLLARGSRHIWFAVIGPDTPAFGELKFEAKYFQKQVAKTIAAFLGLQYKAKQTPGESIQTMIASPQSITTVVRNSGRKDRVQK